MIFVLVFALFVSGALTAPAKESYPDPYPGYKADPSILVREFNQSHLPKLLPELESLRNKSRMPLVDRTGAMYIPLPEPSTDIKRKVSRTLVKNEDLVLPDEKYPDIRLFHTSTTHDGKFKRYIYTDLDLNLYAKV